MAKYLLTNKAVEDLSAIWDYTYETWSEKQADKYYQLLMDACTRIAEKPAIGRQYESISNDISGLTVEKHIVFYRITAKKEIEILRFLHINMDLRTRIKE